MARALAGNATDCSGAIAPTVKTCGDFYEWNARVQLSTWNPVPYGAKAIPGGPIDYASKHWSGLIKDYYSERAKKITAGAIAAAKAGTNFSKAADDDVRAHNAYAWQTSTNVCVAWRTPVVSFAPSRRSPCYSFSPRSDCSPCVRSRLVALPFYAGTRRNRSARRQTYRRRCDRSTHRTTPRARSSDAPRSCGGVLQKKEERSEERTRASSVRYQATSAQRRERTKYREVGAR